jgi:hypothetical protein
MALVLYSIIFADAPSTICMQGRITTNTGTPISGPGNFSFIFDDGSNTTQFTTLTDVNLGLYSVNIDLSTLGTLDFSKVVNVEVLYNTISLGTTKLTASPYAFCAASATYSAVATSATSATCSVDNSFTIGGYALTYNAGTNNIVVGSSLSIQGNLEVTGDVNISSVSFATLSGTAAYVTG